MIEATTRVIEEVQAQQKVRLLKSEIGDAKGELLEILRLALMSNYVNDNLVTLLGSIFGDATLGSLSKNAIVSAVHFGDGTGWTPVKFSRRETPDVRLVDAALASGAAPTYFPPHQVPNYGLHADGGLFVNNPSMMAVAEAKAVSGSLDDITVLSIGTGHAKGDDSTPSTGADAPLGWGILRWMLPPNLINALMGSTAMYIDQQCSDLLGGDQYRRLQLQLPHPFPMDDPSRVPELKAIVEDYVRKDPDGSWRGTVAWVADAFAAAGEAR